MALIDLFERGPGEPAAAYHAFCHYRNLGPGLRSLDRAWREHHKNCLNQVQPVTRRRPMSWGNWSARWGWVERAAAYDTHVDREKRAALETEQVEVSRRHARLIQAAINATMVPIRIALETAASPAGLEALRTAAQAHASGLRAAVAEARQSAAHLPALVGAERLTLGMSTENQQVSDIPIYDPVAARIAVDPTAMSLALQLLDTVARPMPSE